MRKPEPARGCHHFPGWKVDALSLCHQDQALSQETAGRARDSPPHRARPGPRGVVTSEDYVTAGSHGLGVRGEQPGQCTCC